MDGLPKTVLINLNDEYLDVNARLPLFDQRLTVFTYHLKNLDVLCHQLIYAALDMVANQDDSAGLANAIDIFTRNGLDAQDAKNLSIDLVSVFLRAFQRHFTVPIVRSGLRYTPIEIKHRILTLQAT